MPRSLFYIVIFSFGVSTLTFAQNADGHFLFEPEKFSPPVKDMIAHYEGFPATPFMANNLDDEELYIGDFKGKPLILFFWSIENPNCTEKAKDMSKLTEHYQDKLQIVSFADEDRPSMKKYVSQHQIPFHVIPNSRIFGEAAYANELGYPRAFLIDEYGVIKKVVPEEAFMKSGNAFEMIKSLVDSEL